MATLAEMEDALVNADRAGDTAAARQLADAITQMRTKPPVEEASVVEAPEGVASTLTHPGLLNAAVDSAGMGWGNELVEGGKAFYKSATDGQGPEKTFRGYYDKGMAETEAETEDFRGRHPKTALAADILPAIASGGAALKMFNPSTWPRALAASGIEGAITGAGASKPGLDNRLTGAKVGGALGLVGGAGGTLLEKLLGNAKRVTSGFGELVTKGEKKVNDASAKAQAWAHISNTAKRAGETEQTLAGKIGKDYSKTETVADQLAGGKELLEPTAGRSDATRALAEDSVINARTKTTSERLRGDLGVDSKQLAASSKYAGKLEDVRAKAGTAIEGRVRELHGEPLDNQEEIADFLALKKNRGLKNKVIATLEIDGLDPKYVDTEADDVLGEFIEEGAEDANTLIYDEPFLQEVIAELNSQASALKKEGKSFAATVKLVDQAKELVERGAVDDTLKSLRGEYGVAIKNKKAFAEGSEKFGTMKESDVLATVKEMTPPQLEAFREGALESLANKKTDMLSFLDNDGELRKVAAVFGKDKAKTFKTLGEKFTKEREVSDSLVKGVTGQKKSIATDTLAGKMEAIVDVFSRLRGKRAYGVTGGAFMVANEVIDIMMTSTLPEPVVREMLKTLSKSGDDVGRTLSRIKDVEMPLLVKNQMIEAATKAANKARMGGYATGAAAAGSED